MKKQELTNRGARGRKMVVSSCPPGGAQIRAHRRRDVTAIFAFMAWETLAWPMAAHHHAWTLAFFRDPARALRRIDDRFVVAPADGLVTLIQDVLPPPELSGPAGLGNAADDAGVDFHERVRRAHQPRAPFAAQSRVSPILRANSSMLISTRRARIMSASIFSSNAADGVKIGFTQIAGLVARRIVAFVQEGRRHCGRRTARRADPFR
jgi:phosphatidylserine decarboxylase